MSDYERRADQEARIKRLEAQVENLSSTRPGRKRMPIVVSHQGVCGVDPKMDSAACPYASVYRRQQGCLGDACMRASSTYYREYRSNRSTE
jgi:hypothetical protein